MFTTDWGLTNAVNDLEKMMDQFTRSFRVSRRGVPFLSHLSPALNVWANEDAVVVTGEIPGVESSSIGVSVMGDTLTITGKRSFSGTSAPTADYATEFNRSIQLPYRVNSEETEARCLNGVLTVVMHRPVTEKPRKISVNAA